MSFIKRVSFRNKFIATNLLILTITLAILIVSVIFTTEYLLRKQFRVRIEEANALLNSSITPFLIEEDIASVRDLIEEIRNDYGIQYIFIYDLEGKKIIQIGWPLDKPFPKSNSVNLTVSDKEVYSENIPLVLENQRYGELYYGISIEYINKFRNSLILYGIIATFFAFVLTFILVNIVANWLTKDLYKLINSSKKIAKGDLNAFVNVESQDEIGILAGNFNSMIVKIQKQIEEIQNSDERFNLAVNGSKDGIWDWENISRDECWWSPRIFEMLGYEHEEVIPRVSLWQELIHPEDKENVNRILQNHLNQGRPYEAEFRMKNKSGDYLWMLARGESVRDKNGKPVRMAGSVTDITKRKHNEEEIRKYSSQLEIMVNERTEQLEKAQTQLISQERLASIGKLSGSVAHDIRNPLGSISNSIYFLNMIIGDQTDAQIKKHIGIMMKEINRANDIISDLMDFSKGDQPVLVEGNINKIILDLIDEFIPPKNIIIENKLESNLPLFSFDHSQLRRVVHNLLTNSIQAMPEGGNITISSSFSDGIIEIRVEDTGMGVSPDHIEKIYEPLFTTKSKGMGLGLSIVKTFVEKHNGSIEVESELNKGTTFSVKLPTTMESNLYS